jgi:hypothetical protein
LASLPRSRIFIRGGEEEGEEGRKEKKVRKIVINYFQFSFPFLLSRYGGPFPFLLPPYY